MNNGIIRNKQLNNVDYNDKRRKTSLVLDVETAMSENNEQLIFDIGWTISSPSNKEFVLHRSYLVKEIFLDMKLMERAYYFKKYPIYVMGLADNETEILPFAEILQILNTDIQNYNVNKMYAYNALFDASAINKTYQYLIDSESEMKYKIDCLWHLSTKTFMYTEKYINVAIENNWLSDKGNIKTSAEMAYRYISHDYDFVEAHTALQDTVIETKILWKLYNYPKEKRETTSQAWRRIRNLMVEKGLDSKIVLDN